MNFNITLKEMEDEVYNYSELLEENDKQNKEYELKLKCESIKETAYADLGFTRRYFETTLHKVA